MFLKLWHIFFIEQKLNPFSNPQLIPLAILCLDQLKFKSNHFIDVTQPSNKRSKALKIYSLLFFRLRTVKQKGERTFFIDVNEINYALILCLVRIRLN